MKTSITVSIILLCSLIPIGVFGQKIKSSAIITYLDGTQEKVEIIENGFNYSHTELEIVKNKKTITLSSDTLKSIEINQDQKYVTRTINDIRNPDRTKSSGKAFLKVYEEGLIKMMIYKTDFMYLENSAEKLYKLFSVVKEYDNAVNKKYLNSDTLGFKNLRKGLFLFGKEYYNICSEAFGNDFRIGKMFELNEPSIKKLVRRYNNQFKEESTPISYFKDNVDLYLIGLYNLQDAELILYPDETYSAGLELNFKSKYPSASIVITGTLQKPFAEKDGNYFRFNISGRKYFMLNNKFSPYLFLGINHEGFSGSSEQFDLPFFYISGQGGKEKTKFFAGFGFRYRLHKLIHLHLNTSTPSVPNIAAGFSLKLF